MSDTPVNQAAIQEAFNNGEISKADYDFLTKEFDDLGTPQGFELATMKRGYVGAFRPAVDPNGPEANTEAAAQTIQLETTLSRKIDEMQASGKDPRNLFDPTKPDYKSPSDLMRGFVPSAQGASLLRVPESGPTGPEGANKGPQAPDSGPSPEVAAAPTTPPTESGHLELNLPAPWEKQPLLAWPNSAAAPNQLPRADASAETPKPPLSGKQAAATNHEEEKTSELEDIGFLRGGLRAGFMELGLDANSAGHLVDIVAQATSIYPLPRVAFAVDDLLTAIRKDDRLGAVEAILSITPAGRFLHIEVPSAPPEKPGGGDGGHPHNPKPQEMPTATPTTKTVDTTKSDLAPGTEASSASKTTPRQEPTTVSSPEPSPAKTPPETPARNTRPANLGPSRARLVAAGLDHLAAQLDNREVQSKIADAIKRGTAKDTGDGIGFVSQAAFENVFGPAGDNRERHHIVNKHGDNLAKFGPFYIHNTSNFISLPKADHIIISSYYSSSKDKAIKGFTNRNWLKPASFDSQHIEGITIVLKFFDPKLPSKP